MHQQGAMLSSSGQWRFLPYMTDWSFCYPSSSFAYPHFPCGCSQPPSFPYLPLPLLIVSFSTLGSLNTKSMVLKNHMIFSIIVEWGGKDRILTLYIRHTKMLLWLITVQQGTCVNNSLMTDVRWNDLHTERVRREMRWNISMHRIINLRNNLPCKAIGAIVINEFKRHLDCFQRKEMEGSS